MDPVQAKAQADAAAAELLAELEQEEEQHSKQTNSKKKRKKKKKHDDDEHHHHITKEEAAHCKKDSPPQDQKKPSLEPTEQEENDDDSDGPRFIEIIPDDQEEDPQIIELVELPEPEPEPPAPTEEPVTAHEEPVNYEQQPQLVDPLPVKHELKPQLVDPMQTQLCDLVNAEDIQGIEDLLEEWKGVPGKAALRKNAKKALKRLKDQNSGQPQPRLKIISTMPKSSTTRETVMEMDSSIVGFVIGKGGQKIRDLMDESGAKVWIDQESMATTHDPRIVYVSGAKKAVDIAVKMIQEMVKEAENPPSPVVVESSEPAVVVEEGPPGPDEALPAGWIREKITCEARFVPLLIGRRGWTIKHIQDASGAKVDIDQSVTPRIIFVTGTTESVQTAKRLISDVLSYPHAQLKNDHPDDSELFVADERHSPPPTSHVMTGDIKSTVSASSSLSCTPEPSVASSKGRELVMPPPGLFENNRRSDGLPLAQRYSQPVSGYNGEQFVQPNFANMQQQQQQSNVQPPNLLQAQMAPPLGHHMGGMGHQQQLRGPSPMMGPQLMPPPHMQQQQQHSMHHQLNQLPMQCGMHMNPNLISQHQMAMQQQQMAIAQQQHRGGFMPPHGNPNEAGMRFGGIGPQPLGQSLGQQRQNMDLPLFGGANDTRGSGLLHQPQQHSLLPPAFQASTQQSSESIGIDLAVNSGGLLQPGSLSGSMLSPVSVSARQRKDSFPGALATSGSQEESNLIDSLFAPSTGGEGSSLLAGLKGLNVGGDNWEGSSGIPGWDEEKSRLPIQQPNESRFQWGS